MNDQYDPEEFKEKLNQRVGRPLRPCPFCGKTTYSISSDYVSMFTQKEYKTLQLGNNIPCGVMFCDTCGHVDLFALGTLGMLKKQNTEG